MGSAKKLLQEFWKLNHLYGFNKSHAAKHAIISYQTAYLKTYYLKFIAASMTMDISNQINLVNFMRNLRD